MPAVGPTAALKRVKRLASTPNTNRIDLALALADLDAEPGAVADFIKTTPKTWRATYALLEVGKWLEAVKLPMERATTIGWTKLAILARHCSERPGKKATRTELDHAEARTAAELPSILTHYLTSKPPAKRRSVMLRLTPDQFGVFEAALRKHGAMKSAKGKGLTNKEAAVMAIIGKVSGAS